MLKLLLRCSSVSIWLFALLSASTGFAQSTSEIIEWRGGSGDWNSNLSWTPVSGKAAIPTKNSVIWIETAEDLEITLSTSIAIRSLVLTGSGHVTFRSSSPIKLSISDQFTVAAPTPTFNQIEVQAANPKILGHLIDSGTPELANDVNQKGSMNQSLAKAGGSCPFFDLTPNPSRPSCNGFNNGIASVEPPTGGVGPYTFQWVGGPSTRQWFNVGAGTYTIIVIDLGQGGLPCNTDVFVNEPGPLTVFSNTSSPPLCADVCNGTAFPIVIGGNGGYTYSWSSGETTQSASALCVNYSLEVTDLQGCQLDSNFVFANAPDTIKFEALLINVDCFGENNGEIDLTTTGGVGVFDYSWSGPNGFSSNMPDITGLQPGTYTLSVVDDNNCLADTVFTITENPELSASASIVNNPCFGEANGSINLTVSGGNPPYFFAWTGPDGFVSTSQNIVNLIAGQYNLTLIDNAGCQVLASYSVTEPTEIISSLTKTDLLCFGDSDGGASASSSGGTAPYIYSWSGPNNFAAGTSDISGLLVGTYVVEITDFAGCAILDSITILEPEILEIASVVDPVTCNNGLDGAIDITVEGGTIPYQFAWTGPGSFTASTEDVENLASGTYEITVTDANNCTSTSGITLDNPPVYVVNALLTPLSCADSNDGSIELTISGGLAPYDFQWTGPDAFVSTTEDISGLSAGVYSVTITDQLGCEALGTFEVMQPTELAGTITGISPSCFGLSDGSLTAILAGGNPSYTYSWTGPNSFLGTGENLTGLAAGLYTLTAFDQNSCEFILDFDLAEPDELLIDATIENPTCADGTNGAIAILVTGGLPGYSYLWAGPNSFVSSDQNLTGLTVGSYLLTVTDQGNCLRDTTFQLFSPSEITVDADVNDAICSSDGNGSISLAIDGGTEPYIISWSGPGSFTSDQALIELLEVGVYSLTIVDAQGCTFAADYTISTVFELMIDATLLAVDCAGANTGAITANASGGIAPYGFSWSGPNSFLASTSAISDLVAGVYTLTVIDFNGCFLIETFEVIEPPMLSISIVTTSTTCSDLEDGSIVATISGGVSPYVFAWSGPNNFMSNSNAITDLAAGTYTLIATDANNCDLDTVINILSPAALAVDITIVLPGCTNSDGSITATVVGGTVATDYLYEWMNQSGQIIGSTAEILGLSPGDYYLIVLDDNGCALQDTITLLQDSFSAEALVNEVTCAGNDGSISLTITGGTEPFGFAWTGPNGFSATDQNIAGLEQGNYAVTITDAGGCVENYTYPLGAANEITFNATIIAERCSGSNDGSIALQPSGGTPGYSLIWTGPSGFTGSGFSNGDLSPGQYFIELTDSDGCATDTIIIIPKAPEYSLAFVTSGFTCAGESTGSIQSNLTILVGSPEPITFSWTGPNSFSSSDPNISGLDAGTYFVEVVDNFGCVQNFVFDIQVADSLEIAVTAQSSNCLQSDGSLSASASGGAGGFSYVWTNQANDTIAVDANVLNIPAGIYTVVATDALGCTTSQTIVLSDNVTLPIAATTPPTCSNSEDGSITIEILNPAEPLTFEWSSNGIVIANSQNLIGIGVGSYSVLISDGNGCVFGTTISLSGPEAISANASILPVSCAGADGEISVVISGGSPNYEINWIGPDGFISMLPQIENLSAGTYSYIIEDALGCLLADTLELGVVPALTLTSIIENAVCAGDQNGSIEIQVSGGTPVYTYSWTGPNGFISSIQNIGNLPSGAYSLTLEDSRACVSMFEFQVLQPDSIEVSVEVVQPSCGQSNGSLTASITGGTADFGYFITWTNSAGDVISNNPALSGVEAGIYTLNVVDNNGCDLIESVALSNPGLISTAVVQTESCAGFADGSIDLTVEGITLPFTIVWTGPNGFSESTEDISGLESGVYNYEITSADGCSYFGSYTLDMVAPILVDLQTVPTCFGASSGSINALVSGGQSPYGIEWEGPNGFVSADLLLEDLAPGTYTLSIIDNNACQFNQDIEIAQNPEITATVSSSNSSCFEADNGEVEIAINGGSGALAVEWAGPDGFQSSALSLNDLLAGTYIYVVTDSLACAISGSVDILQPDSLGVNIMSVSPGCSSPQSLGSIDASAFGGIAPYSITWSGPSGFNSDQFILSDLQAGVYVFTLLDDNLCTLVDSVQLLAAIPIEITALVTNQSCSDSLNGSIAVEILGGSGPFEVAWVGPSDFTSNELIIDQLIPGNYSLSLTDALGCALDTTFTLTAPEPLNIQITEQINATCNTSDDGAVSVAVAGGTLDYSFAWSGPNGFTSENQSLSNLTAGGFNLTLTDGNGCAESLDVVIGFDLEISVDAGNDTTICASDLPLWLDGAGVNIDAYVWTDEEGGVLADSLSVMINEGAGAYTFVLEGLNGTCIARDTVLVNVLLGPDVDAGADQEVFIDQSFTIGGSPTSLVGVSYNWSPAAQGSFDPSSPNPTGFLTNTTEFVVEVTDVNGCRNTDSTLVVVLPEVNLTSGFTPNGDGVNDRWVIDNMELFPNNAVNVFNRWGTILYQRVGYNSGNAWDGTYEGKELPVGTYYYTIELNDARFPDPLTGPITIVR